MAAHSIRSPHSSTDGKPIPPADRLELIRALRWELQQDEVDMQHLADRLAAVPELARRILASANSALMGGTWTICDLRHAVVYLGLRRVDDCLRGAALQIAQGDGERRAA